MGEVYLAEDKTLNRQVAMKLLPRSMHSDRQRLRRFRQEALAVSALNHPNILTIFEADSVDGKYLFTAEYVNGETLRERIKREPLDTVATLEIAIQIASALQAAHKAGIIHRDIKPENIMIRDDGYVKVLDFGLAKLIGDGPFVEGRSQFISNPSTLMGTASYMSPEQVRGHLTDARSDIFSFGVVLYEMLWGDQAFTGETNTDVIAAIIQKDPERPMGLETDVPQSLEALVKRCIQKERLERYQSTDDLLTDLKQIKSELEKSQPGLTFKASEMHAFEGPDAHKKSRGDSGLRKLAYLSMIILLISALAALLYILTYR
jgi:serine/threonine protein kinase